MGNPVTYAEVNLGVHGCYDAANAAHSQLNEIVSDLDKAQDRKRILTDQVTDREMDLLIAERGKHSDMSEAGLERHMKTVKHKDTMLTELRKQLNQTLAQISGLEYDADIEKQRIKIESARMEELGGYLKYLAAAKEAESLNKRINLEERRA